MTHQSVCLDQSYSGARYNPDFVRRVWAKRREQDLAARRKDAARKAAEELRARQARDEKRQEASRKRAEERQRRAEKKAARSDLPDGWLEEREAKNAWQNRVIDANRMIRTMRDIVKFAAAVHDVGVDEVIHSKSRVRKLVECRHDAMAAIRARALDAGEIVSLTQIGIGLGGLDHTTVLHGLRRRGWTDQANGWRNGKPEYFHPAMYDMRAGH